jgi:hypothetical protein
MGSGSTLPQGGSVAPKVAKWFRRKGRISDRMADVPVSQVVLNRTCVVTVASQLVACGMLLPITGKPNPPLTTAAQIRRLDFF